MIEEKKPNCYECQHVGKLVGDAHSYCKHPFLGDIGDNLAAQILNLQAGIDKLGIKANCYGIKRGWFNFPFNYDPVWLEACNGFESNFHSWTEF